MAWFILFLASIFEISFTFCLGKVRIVSGNAVYLWYSLFVITAFASMLLLVKATKTLPISIVYPIWTGIGAVGTVLIGIFVFKEPASFLQIFFIFTLIASIVGLQLLS